VNFARISARSVLTRHSTEHRSTLRLPQALLALFISLGPRGLAAAQACAAVRKWCDLGRRGSEFITFSHWCNYPFNIDAV
jgi:hypothetical protein